MSRPGSRSSRGVTIRMGTGERNWYLSVAYIATAVIGVLYSWWTFEQTGAYAGITIGIVMLGLAVFGLATLPAIFKDSAYLRGTAAGWRPKWWYYILAPLIVPFAVYYATGELLTQAEAGVFALLSFLLLSIASNAMYLYRRHKFVGVP